ncbi:MAG TPA: hypothetical protein VLH19_05100 [Patescibacteria group bacterium]|nr:hypothetical protein [Patescibacteria group bacterium]
MEKLVDTRLMPPKLRVAAQLDTITSLQKGDEYNASLFLVQTTGNSLREVKELLGAPQDIHTFTAIIQIYKKLATLLGE